MPDFQTEVFRWVAGQPGGTGACIFAAGILYGFFGFRMFSFLLAMSAAGLGMLVGLLVAVIGEAPLVYVLPAFALGFGAVAFYWPRAVLAITGSIAFAVLAAYLSHQLGVRDLIALSVTGITAVVAGLLAVLNRKTMTVIVTTLQGAALLIVGFVGVTSAFIPSIGGTFREWAAAQSMLVPILWLMLFVTTYSYQAMRQQGDLITGK